jgi:hypothetical protein
MKDTRYEIQQPYEIEVAGAHFYLQTAETCTNPHYMADL